MTAEKQTRVPHTAGADGVASPTTTTGAKRDETEGQAMGGIERDEAAGAGKAKDAPSRPLLSRMGLDLPTLMLMFKGSLPPVICVAMLQSDSLANHYSNLGYEIPIISIMAMAILPRGKFLQTLTLNLLAVCVGAAVALLVLWSGIQARLHTTTPSPPAPSSSSPAATTPPAAAAAAGTPLRAPYNSSQSAVCGVWLFANIWLVNTLRAKLPSFNLPAIVYSIFVNIAATFGPSMTATAQAETFVTNLLTSMLLALAVSTGVSLLVFPISSRRIVTAQFAGAIGLLRKAVALQGRYLETLEREDMFALEPVETAVGGDLGRKKSKKRTKGRASRNTKKEQGEEETEEEPLTKEAKAAQDLREVITALRGMAGKLQGEVPFAKRDAAFGKLSAHDLGEIFNLIRQIYIPVTGMSTIMDIFRRASQHCGWNLGEDATAEDVAAKEADRHLWNEVMKQLHEPFRILSDAIDQGLEHAGLQLELLPRPKAPSAGVEGDAEARGDSPVPGESGFARVLDEKVKLFHGTKHQILHVWARERGLTAAGDDDDHDHDYDEGSPASSPSDKKAPLSNEKERSQAQLYVLLYMEQLMHATGEAVQDLVDFADRKVADGTMRRARLHLPTARRVRKWIASVFGEQDSNAEESPDVLEGAASVVYVGDSFSRKKDPEHLPPTNAWERFGNGLRVVFRFFGSPESMFGVRAACATMTIGIVSFLERTQVFFMEQRLVWAMIIIAIGMTQTSGQSIFGFVCRVGGSFLAMVFSLVIWYVVDEKTAGAVVFLWLFLFCEYYFLIKFPRVIPASMITIVTQVLIIGYELQVRKIGIARSEATGQRYYPTYELAPYRLATVAAGCLVAFVWTVFPRALTDRTWMRRDLSATLYLLANYFSAVNETTRATMSATAGDVDVPGSPAHQLRKVRQKLFGKLMLILPSLETHAQWQKWEPSIGGRFPREEYDDIILRANRILNYLTLISYSVTWTPRDHPDEGDGKQDQGRPLPPRPLRRRATVPDRKWLIALRDLIADIAPSHYSILSTLTLLSNSLLSGQSLPPYIPLPRPYELTRRLLALQGPPYPPSEHDDKDGVAQRDTLYDDEPRGEAATRRRRSPRHPRTGGILDARNAEQAGYTEFAVLQVCSTLVCDDLEGLVGDVGRLVGVVDFSFRVGRPYSESSLSSVEDEEGGGGGGGGGVFKRRGSRLQALAAAQARKELKRGKGKRD